MYFYPGNKEVETSKKSSGSANSCYDFFQWGQLQNLHKHKSAPAPGLLPGARGASHKLPPVFAARFKYTPWETHKLDFFLAHLSSLVIIWSFVAWFGAFYSRSSLSHCHNFCSHCLEKKSIKTDEAIVKPQNWNRKWSSKKELHPSTMFILLHGSHFIGL